MTLLVLGLAIFLGAHVFITFREARAGMIARLGPGGWKALFSLVSLVGLVLIVIGFGRYRASGYVELWSPPVWTRHLALLLMWFSFVALAASQGPRGMIAGMLRHPMLVGVKIWALAHLLANGDLGSVLLFGSLLAYAVYDRIAVKRRGDNGAPAAAFGRADVIVLVVGTVFYAAMLWLHPMVIGVPVIGR